VSKTPRTPGPLVSPLAILAGHRQPFSFSWNPDSDVLQVQLVDQSGPVRRIDVTAGVTLCFQRGGMPVGVELRAASTHWPRVQLALLQGPLLTIPEAAKMARRSPKTISAQIANGKITTVKRGRDRFVTQVELFRYLDRLSPSGRKPGTMGRQAGRRRVRR
jgi:hypothetical protein